MKKKLISKLRRWLDLKKNSSRKNSISVSELILIAENNIDNSNVRVWEAREIMIYLEKSKKNINHQYDILLSKILKKSFKKNNKSVRTMDFWKNELKLYKKQKEKK